MAPPLRWRHNGRDGISNHQPHDCLLNRLFRPRSKKTSKLHFTGLCAGRSPGTGEFPAQMASNAEHVSIWWRHHVAGKRIVNHSDVVGALLFALRQLHLHSRHNPWFQWIGQRQLQDETRISLVLGLGEMKFLKFDCNKLSHMSQQHRCCDMCENLLQLCDNLLQSIVHKMI